jgi:hypothetical protein
MANAPLAAWSRWRGAVNTAAGAPARWTFAAAGPGPGAPAGAAWRESSGRMLLQILEKVGAVDAPAAAPAGLLARASAIAARASALASTSRAAVGLHPAAAAALAGAALLCLAAVAVVAMHWSAERAAWRRRCREQAQGEAARVHVSRPAAGESVDLESPTKKRNSDYSDDDGAAARASPVLVLGGERRAPAAGLPGAVLLRRAPSLRADVFGRGAAAAGARAPSHLRRAGSSAQSSAASSAVSSPRAPHADAEDIVHADPSVEAQDATAMGWAPNPYARARSADSSGCPSPRSPGAASPGSSGGYEPSPGWGAAGAATPTSRLRPAPGSPPAAKPLTRAGTEPGLNDFRLGTAVDAEEEEAVLERRRTDSGERRALHTARTVGPAALVAATVQAAGEAAPRAAALPAPPAPPTPAPLERLTIGGVPLLSPAEFDAEVAPLRVLGVGGAGTVHEATWHGRRVAVKLLHPARQASPAAAAALRREAGLLAQLGDSRGVVRLLAACAKPPRLALVLELGARGSLASALHARRERPRYGELLRLAEGVAAALAACHALAPPVVHRDLKSANVLLDAAGAPLLADFGLAAAKTHTFLTLEDGAALGTASVMAPEQFAAGRVDERCDAYAFGCLLWELVAGRPPWGECVNVMQVVMAVGCERRRPPVPAGTPPALSRLIDECWRHAAALRPGFPEILARLRALREEAGGAALEARAAAAARAKAPPAAAAARALGAWAAA